MLAHNFNLWFDQMWMLKVNFHQISWGRRNRVISIFCWIETYWHWIQGAPKGIRFPFSLSTKFPLWVTEAIYQFSTFLRAMVQLVYEIHNFYCISAGFNEGQALGRIQAPLVPVLNPMQWTQCLTDFWHLLNSEMPWLFLHAPSVASPDWFCLNLSCRSQLSWPPRVWKFYTGVTHHLIIISLYAIMLKLRRNLSPLFIFALYVLFLVSLIQWQTIFIFNSSLSINLKTHFLGNSLGKIFSKSENHI